MCSQCCAIVWCRCVELTGNNQKLVIIAWVTGKPSSIWQSTSLMLESMKGRSLREQYPKASGVAVARSCLSSHWKCFSEPNMELGSDAYKYLLLAGWMNVLGQFASTAGAGYLTAVHIGQMVQLGNGHETTKQDCFLMYASAPLNSSPHFNNSFPDLGAKHFCAGPLCCGDLIASGS